MGKKRPNLAFVTALSALVAQACGQTDRNGAPADAGSELAGAAGQREDSGSDPGGAGGGGQGGSGGTVILVPGAGSAGESQGGCVASGLFTEQVVRDAQVGEKRVFYSWTTAEQVAELRAGGPLFSRSERPGEGRGLLFEKLAAYAEAGTASDNQLADKLGSEIFAKARFAWTNPWSTLLGFPGESYGDQLLRIELDVSAWIAYFADEGLWVVDSKNDLVPMEQVLANPARIGAIFHQSRASGVESPYCGTFSQGAVGFREFALGNFEQIASWSIATPQIKQRLRDDIEELQAFEAELACLNVPDQAAWSDDVACLWSMPPYGEDSLQNYDASLGLPSELYWPSPENIAALIATLEASMPTGAPLTVIPVK